MLMSGELLNLVKLKSIVATQNQILQATKGVFTESVTKK